MVAADPAAPHFDTIQEIVLRAHERLGPPIWEYVTYGSETETAVRRNRYALDSWAIKPRIARDMSEIDPRTSLINHSLRIPVMLAPIGSIARFDPQGAMASARAARDFETLQFVASHAAPELRWPPHEPPLPLIYALHPTDDRDALDAELDEVAARGYLGISVATQSAFYSRRERDICNHLLGKGQLADSLAPYVVKHHKNWVGEPFHRAMLSWDLVEHVKKRSGLPLILKGVQTAEDAELALQHGVDVIYVSNNGGRALDHVRGAIEVLPEVVAAVVDRAEVIVDGGFVRGSDVIKALALGAKAVCLGRLQAWALAADGSQGVVRALELLEEEMVINMGLMGVRTVAELTPASLERVTPCVAPHPLSAFPIVYETLIQPPRPTGS